MADSNSNRAFVEPVPPAGTSSHRSPQNLFRRLAPQLLALAILFGAVWLVYGRAIDAPFIFDDPASIAENPSILRLWPLWGDVEHRGPLNPPADLPTSGRPLVNLSLAINYHFGQLDPAGYRILNLIVHALSTFLLMAIIQRTLCLDYFAEKFSRASGPLAFLVALLWALHPLQTETVVYITQRTELLVGFFYLATIYASLRYWAAASLAGRTAWLGLATLVCLSGMACKEVMVTAPLMVLLFDRTFISGSVRQALQKSWPLYVGLFSSWLLLLGLNFSAPRSLTAGFHLDVPAYSWWLTQTKVLLTYLKLTVWSWPLSIHYEMPYLTTLSETWPWFLPVALMGIVTLVLLCRREAIGFVGAWVFLILSPTLIVPIITEVAAERRMYLPLAALVTLAVVGGYFLVCKVSDSLAASDAKRKSTRRWLELLSGALALVVVVMLGVASADRLEVYHDSVALWQNALASQPDDYVAHNNLGSALAKTGRAREAIEHFNEALHLKSNYPQAHFNLGLAFAEAGRLPEAIDQYQQALRLRPNYPEARGNLAIALSMAGHKQESIEQFKLLLQLKPNQATAHFNLGFALVGEGNLPDAMEQYEQAIRLEPDYTQAYANLAQVYADTGRHAESRIAAQKALQLARSQNQTDLAERLEAWLATDPRHSNPEGTASPSNTIPPRP